MNIFVTGCTCRTGVGRYLVERLSSKADILITCLVRKESNADWTIGLRNVRLVYGSLDEFDTFSAYMSETNIVVHIAGIRRALSVIRTMEELEVNRGIFVNTTGVFSKFRVASEEYRIIESEMIEKFSRNEIKYTIIRPTMIYGNGRDNNVRKIALYLSKHTFFPIFGDGSALIQPVYYKDVAKALLALLENEQCWGKAYNISGREPITYKRFIEIIAEAIGRKVKFVRLPLFPIVTSVSLLNKIIPGFLIKSEQILRTVEDRVFDYKDAQECFGYDPISFEEGIRLEVEELRKCGYLK